MSNYSGSLVSCGFFGNSRYSYLFDLYNNSSTCIVRGICMLRSEEGLTGDCHL